MEGVDPVSLLVAMEGVDPVSLLVAMEGVDPVSLLEQESASVFLRLMAGGLDGHRRWLVPDSAFGQL